jgi:hypothetical protein
MTKDLVGEPVVNDDNTVDLTYAITVRNHGAGATSYDLADELTYGNDISVLDASVSNTSPGSITTNPAWNGVSDTTVATDVALGGATLTPVTHTYQVKVHAEIGPAATIADGDCTLGSGEDGTGFLNQAIVTVDRHDLSDDACGDVEPELDITKRLTGKPTVDADGLWTLDYQIDVANTGPAPGSYDLDDELRFGAGVTVSSAEVSNSDPGTIPTNPKWNGASVTRVADDVEIAVGATQTYQVVVTAKVAGTVSDQATDCELGAGETGTGFLNEATLTLPDDTTKESEACGEIPAIGIVKTLVGTPAVDARGNVVATYQLAVKNRGKGEGTYDLTDTIRWGQGLTVSDAEVTGSPAGFSPDPDWDGIDHTVIATGVPLAGGASHLWTVKVTGTVSATLSTASGDCTLGSGESGTGLLNTATVSSAGRKADSAACAPIEQAEKPPAPGVPPGLNRTSIARTGTTIAGLVLTGLAAVAAGWVLMSASRRRRRTAD